MRSSTQRLTAIASTLALALALAAVAGAQMVFEEKAEVEMVAARTAYAPGATVEAAAVVTIEERWHVNANPPSLEYLIPTELALELPPGSGAAEIVYPPAQMLTFAFTDRPIAVYDGTVYVEATFDLPADAEPGTLNVPASLRYQACDDKQCLPPVTATAELALVVDPAGGEAVDHPAFGGTGDAAGAGAAAGGGGLGLAAILLAAVLGGLILNAMPCVLPVLSLKVFGLMKSAEAGRKHLIAGALASTAGILVSFWALAVAAIVAKAAGAAVGWGIQFQQPGFVALLAVVVVLFSLNMWGVFEIPLPARLAQLGGHGRQGVAGHFASGLFATLMATPCSAPFLGTAVGFALGQAAPVILAVFTAVGVGLALPYLLLAAFPALARALPKPGDWMNTLRGVLGFLLAGAAVWLFYVLSAQIGALRLALVQVALLALALFTWLYHRTRTGFGKRLLAGAVAGTAIAGVALAATAEAPTGAAERSASSYHTWLAFDETEAERLAAAGQPVFVDVTADWCLTCKTNEHLVLETAEIADAFARHDVVTMKADWTNRNDTIAAYLARFGKSSIPFYVLYRPGAEPHVFGELLTKGRVIEALESGPALTAAR